MRFPLSLQDLICAASRPRHHASATALSATSAPISQPITSHCPRSRAIRDRADMDRLPSQHLGQRLNGGIARASGPSGVRLHLIWG